MECGSVQFSIGSPEPKEDEAAQSRNIDDLTVLLHQYLSVDARFDHLIVTYLSCYTT